MATADSDPWQVGRVNGWRSIQDQYGQLLRNRLTTLIANVLAVAALRASYPASTPILFAGVIVAAIAALIVLLVAEPQKHLLSGLIRCLPLLERQARITVPQALERPRTDTPVLRKLLGRPTAPAE